MEVDRISGIVVDQAYRLHTRLGPGLLESVYETILARLVHEQGLEVERQKVASFQIDGVVFENALRIDLLVEGQVVVELKSVEKLASVHSKQLLTYLRLLDLRVGLLINFGAPHLNAGLRRIVNRYDAPPTPDALRRLPPPRPPPPPRTPREP